MNFDSWHKKGTDQDHAQPNTTKPHINNWLTSVLKLIYVHDFLQRRS